MSLRYLVLQILHLQKRPPCQRYVRIRQEKHSLNIFCFTGNQT